MSLEDRFQFVELVAVQWNDDMAQRFPNMNHAMCRQYDDGNGLRCMGWHCNRCGVPTNMYGHHNCPDRPEVTR